MIQHVSGDIFVSPAQTLVNAVNTAGVMGKGIAAEFKRRFPDMFVRYRQLCRSGALEVGKLDLYCGSHPWVLNFPTKQHFSAPSQLEWIDAGLIEFAQSHARLGITSVAFPRLGCGHGGLAWDLVGPLMEQHLSGLPIPVFIHSLDEVR